MGLIEQVYNTQNGVTGGVWRDGDVIIKRLREHADVTPMWRPSVNPRNWLYWRREADAYESDLPARLGLRGPRLHSSTPIPGGIELRLEAFDGRTASDLGLPDLEELARQLGEAQGRVDQPADAWLSRGFLRDYSLAERAISPDRSDEEAWSLPLVAPYVTDALRSDLDALHSNRERLLAISEALPRTVCHLDLFPNNVFVTDSGVAIIDWSFSGDGSIGEDIGNLIPDSILDLNLPLSELEALENALPAAYCAGLRNAGWTGDDRLAMLGIHASAVKYDWLTPRLLARAREPAHSAYGAGQVDSSELFAARWGALGLIGRWARLAVAEADSLRIG